MKTSSIPSNVARPEHTRRSTSSSRDFYQKLADDFDDYGAQKDSARLAMIAAITAFHMHEPVWGDFLKKDKGLRQRIDNIEDKQAFLAYRDKTCLYMRVIQDVTNGSKHFSRDAAKRTSKVRGFGMGGFGMEPYGVGYLAVNVGSDEAPENIAFASVLEIVMRFWCDFMRFYSRYKEDIPKTKEKLMDEQEGLSPPTRPVQFAKPTAEGLSDKVVGKDDAG